MHCAFLFLVCLLKQISKYLCPSHFLVLLSCHCSVLCHFATPCHKLCHFLTDEMQFPNAWTTNVPPLKYFSSLKILGVLWFFSQYIWKWSDAGLWMFERPTIRWFFCAHEERIYSLIYSLSAPPYDNFLPMQRGFIVFWKFERWWHCIGGIAMEGHHSNAAFRSQAVGCTLHLEQSWKSSFIQFWNISCRLSHLSLIQISWDFLLQTGGSCPKKLYFQFKLDIFYFST